MNENNYLEEKNEMIGEKSLMKKILKKRLNQKGLTLIELLAVIVILAIIAAIAIPAIAGIINNSRVGAVKSDAINAINASTLYFTDQANQATVPTEVTVDVLVDGNYLETAGSLADTATVYKVDGGNEIAGAGTAGGITVNFGDLATDDGVSVAEINAVPNSERDASSDDTLTID